ncbi:MAG: alpha/beta hydrolase [Dehalococcoidia bacterium]
MGDMFARLAGVALVAFALGWACSGDAVDPNPGSPGTTVTPTLSPPAPSPTPTATPTAAGEALPTPTPPSAPSRQLGTRTVETTARPPDFDPLPGASAHFGQLGDAVYRIEIPRDWNGDLVLWAHGFRDFGTEVRVSSPPRALREALIAEGYAWAASSYSENGYTPGIGADDTLALKRFFVDQFGEPARTYIVGASMGGNVVVLSLEHFDGEYDGGLSLCGAVGGQEQIDYLLTWAMVAEFVTGASLPIGQGQAAMGATMLGTVLPALGEPAAPTEAGRRFANIMMHFTGGPRPFFQEGFEEQFLLNFGYIMSDPDRQLLVSRAATNIDHVYHIDPGFGLTDDELNAGVRRLPADPLARDADRHPDAVPTTGRLTAPLLSLHGTGDLFVPIHMEDSYREKAAAAGVAHLLVQRASDAPGHCTFTDDEVVTAWHDLVAWVEEGVVPDGWWYRD